MTESTFAAQIAHSTSSRSIIAFRSSFLVGRVAVRTHGLTRAQVLGIATGAGDRGALAHPCNSIRENIISPKAKLFIFTFQLQ
ncbi:hypothetical protein D3C86_1681190 [compost metagenome]